MFENNGISYRSKDTYIESAPAINVPNAPSIEKRSPAKDAPKVPGESQTGYLPRPDVIALSPNNRDAVRNTSRVPRDCLARWGIFLESNLERLK